MGKKHFVRKLLSATVAGTYDQATQVSVESMDTASTGQASPPQARNQSSKAPFNSMGTMSVLGEGVQPAGSSPNLALRYPYAPYLNVCSRTSSLTKPLPSIKPASYATRERFTSPLSPFRCCALRRRSPVDTDYL